MSYREDTGAASFGADLAVLLGWDDVRGQAAALFIGETVWAMRQRALKG